MVSFERGEEKMDKIPTMLTINQTAERSGLATHYVRQLCLQGKVTYCRAGNKYLVNFEKFVDFLNTGESLAPACIAGIRDLSKR
mgnify:CR=1 FL=1